MCSDVIGQERESSESALNCRHGGIRPVAQPIDISCWPFIFKPASPLLTIDLPSTPTSTILVDIWLPLFANWFSKLSAPSTSMVSSNESRVDVLVLGAGPAGLMCGNALARAGVNVRIVDKR
jgi:hypothetical protein